MGQKIFQLNYFAFFWAVAVATFPFEVTEAAVQYSRSPSGSGAASPITINVSFDDFEADTQLLLADCPTWSVEVSDNSKSYYPNNTVPNSVKTGTFVVNLPSTDYRYVAFSCNTVGGGGFLEGSGSSVIFSTRPNSPSVQPASKNIPEGDSLVSIGTTNATTSVPSALPLAGVSVIGSLSKGSRGAQVTLLQQILQRLNFFPKDIEPTGYFGPITEKAVKEFQRNKGIESIGIVGPKTRKALANPGS